MDGAGACDHAFDYGIYHCNAAHNRQTPVPGTDKKSHRLEILLENSSRLRRCVTIRDVENEVAERIVQLMDLSVIFYLRGEGIIRFPFMGLILSEKGCGGVGTGVFKEQQETATAGWVMSNGKRAGCSTSALPSAKAIYLPVRLDETVYAVVGIYLEEGRGSLNLSMESSVRC